MAATSSWLVLPVIGTGTGADPIRPDLTGLTGVIATEVDWVTPVGAGLVRVFVEQS